MKLFIIHGDHTLKSYDRKEAYIEAAKKRGWEILTLSDSSQNIREIMVSQSLFSTERLIVIEDAQIISKKDSDWLKKYIKEVDSSLLIYKGSTLSKTFINSLPKPDKIEEFKLPKTIWNFLDSIYPRNMKTSLNLFHQTLENEPVEFVFAVIAKQIRDLYWVKREGRNSQLSPWQASKLEKIAGKFEINQLEELIESLAKADIDSKTSKQDLVHSLDFIFATELQ